MPRFSIEHFMAWAVNHTSGIDEAVSLAEWLSDKYHEDPEYWDSVGYAQARDAWYNATHEAPVLTPYEKEQKRLDSIYVNVKKA